MAGRTIRDEATYAGGRYDDPVLAKRRAVLRETIAALSGAALARSRANAAANLARWSREATKRVGPLVQVVADDWGVATARATREYGTCFAVLNMANAFVPGGAYVEGTSAQEENMFRRSDCHFMIDAADIDPRTEHYVPAKTRLLEAGDGLVYLDVHTPRVCVRGPEDRSREDLGYAWLADDEVYPFYELRAAAVDLRGGLAYDEPAMRARITAQFATLRRAGIRHAILSAFGCGAFHNPADRIALLYRQAITELRTDFEAIVFSIFAPGYGPDNFTPFSRAFGGIAAR